jgi:hypothetical protein
MTEAKKYLQRRCVVTTGDVVFIGLKDLMEYTKLVQLEATLNFVEDNLPESYGVINDIKFKIREILQEEEVENTDNPFDE